MHTYRELYGVRGCQMPSSSADSAVSPGPAGEEAREEKEALESAADVGRLAGPPRREEEREKRPLADGARLCRDADVIMPISASPPPTISPSDGPEAAPPPPRRDRPEICAAAASRRVPDVLSTSTCSASPVRAETSTSISRQTCHAVRSGRSRSRDSSEAMNDVVVGHIMDIFDLHSRAMLSRCDASLRKTTVSSESIMPRPLARP